jgi:hypothetical protein
MEVAGKGARQPNMQLGFGWQMRDENLADK